MPRSRTDLREWGALGACRAPGESLASWLTAGPLGDGVFASAGLPAPIGPFPYCSSCRFRCDGGLRHYTRATWRNPWVVTCEVHGLPLTWSEVPPLRIAWAAGAGWRAEFRSLARWSASQRDSKERGSIARDLLWALTRRSDPRLPFSLTWSNAHWQRWAEGWPVHTAPRQPLHFSWSALLQPGDRLALAGSVWRLTRELQGEVRAWPALALRERTRSALESRLIRRGVARHRIESLFARIAP